MLADIDIDELDELIASMDEAELDTDDLDQTLDRITTMSDLDDPWCD